MTKTATFLRKMDGYRGDARLYRLSEPIAFDDVRGNFEHRQTCYVVVSAIVRESHPLLPVFSALGAMFGSDMDNSPGGEETFIFPADENGECFNMVQLDGSFQGGRDHAKALRGAGYEVTQ